MLLTPELLVAAGYRSSPSGKHAPECPLLWQRVVRGVGGFNGPKLYFINFYRWDMSQHNSTNPISWEAECTLYSDADNDPEKQVWAKLTLHGLERHPNALEYVEGYFQRAYDALDCIPDVHNNDGQRPPARGVKHRVTATQYCRR
jgi:hypothetical protein